MSVVFSITSENKICRLCLGQTEAYINLFQGKFEDVIHELTSIQISNEDGLPKIACINCIEDIQQANKTRKRIIECQKTLEENLKSQEFSSKPNEMEVNYPEVVILSDYSEEEERESSSPIHELLADYNEDMSEVYEVKNEYLANNYDSEDSKSEPPPKKVLEPAKNKKRLTRKNNPTLGKFTCEVCDLKFTNNYSYYLHCLKHKKSQCKICGICIRSDNMGKHLECHTSGPRICDLCGKTCKNIESLRGHIFYMHRKSADEYKCDQCERSFRMKYKLDLHIKKEHIGVRGHVCGTCKKAFFTVRDMNHHIRMKHLKLRPHVCPHCERGFSSKYALKTHVRQHTNETPYKCYICAEGFRQNVSLRTHLKSKHNIEEEKNFRCEFCDKAFSTTFALKVHLRLHSDDNYKCEHCDECFQQRVFLVNHLKNVHKICDELIFVRSKIDDEGEG